VNPSVQTSPLKKEKEREKEGRKGGKEGGEKENIQTKIKIY
jgi:hypothetical protein